MPDRPVPIVHLVTQRNQPYGSMRKCCERCGLWIHGAPTARYYTEDLSFFHSLPRQEPDEETGEPVMLFPCDGKSELEIAARVHDV